MDAMHCNMMTIVGGVLSDLAEVGFIVCQYDPLKTDIYLRAQVVLAFVHYNRELNMSPYRKGDRFIYQ